MKLSRIILSAALATLMLAPAAFATSGDLALYDGNVNFVSAQILEGNPVRIKANVINNSSSDLLGSVRFSTDKGAIGPDQPISALAGKSDDVFIDWVPTTYGLHNITVQVIPWDASKDDASNNVVKKQVYVEQDTDHDGVKNTLDEDIDGDEVANEEDLYPNDGKESKDTDGDGKGNNSDDDDDNDGVLDLEDQLPENPNASKDMDGDQIPDGEDDDVDGDSLTNNDELQNGTDQLNADTDGDTVNDGQDAFPTDANETSDMDGDKIGDKTDSDIDGDGIDNETDKAPTDSAPVASLNQDVFFTGLGDEITFDASSSKDDGSIIKYIWQFGNETVEGSAVTRTFDSKGLQVATLMITDDQGQISTLDFKVRVLDYKFISLAIFFALLLISIAFYTIYRYNTRAKKPVKKRK